MRLKLFKHIALCFALALTTGQLLAQDRIIEAQDTTDTVSKQPPAKSIETKHSRDTLRHQLRLGVDVSRFVFNNLFPSRKGYGIKADYNWNNTVYLAAEGGWGRGKINYDFLKYKTRGAYIRIGINKVLLGQFGKNDFDNAFIGLRYGVGFGQRGAATFFVPNPFGGQSQGQHLAKGYFVHWGEIVGGISVELFHNIYAGWTIRGKFLFNPKTFKEIAPNYIPGFGKGDKNSIFSFNFYISYGIQWGGNEGK